MKSNLQMVGLLHMIWGGFLGLGGVFVLGIQLIAALGMFAVGGAALAGGGRDAEESGAVLAIIGLAQGVFGLVLGGVFAALAGVHFMAGSRIRGERSSGYVLGMISACMMMLSFPLGTALGVFTIVTLVKPEARALLRG